MIPLFLLRPFVVRHFELFKQHRQLNNALKTSLWYSLTVYLVKRTLLEQAARCKVLKYRSLPGTIIPI